MFTARQLVKACRYQALLKSSTKIAIGSQPRTAVASSLIWRRLQSSGNGGGNNNNNSPDGPAPVKIRPIKNTASSSDPQKAPNKDQDQDQEQQPTKNDDNKSEDSSSLESSSGGINNNGSPPATSNSNGNDDGDRPRGGRRRVQRKNNEEEDKKAVSKKSASDGTSSADATASNSRSSHFGFRPASPSDKKQVLSILVPDRPAIPGYHRACRIHDPEVIYAIRRIFYDNLEDQCIAVFMKRPDSQETTEVLKDVNDAYPVGAYCRIGGVFSRYEDGQPGCTITLLPLSRISAGELVEPKPKTTQNENDKNTNMDVTSFDTAYSDTDLYSLNVPWMKDVKVIDNEPYQVHDPDVQALCAEITEVLRQLSSMSSIFREQIASFAIVSLKPTNESFADPAALADFAAAMSEGKSEIQDILETRNIKERLEKALELVKKELMQINLQDKFKKSVDAKLQNRYKKAYLEEKLGEIKKELGMDTTKEKSSEVFKERMAKLTLPDHVKKAFDEEIVKLENSDPSGMEHSMTRNYVDWLSQMPWGIYSEDKYDIKEARSVLDKGHYGLKDVKDRILEFIATARLSGSVDGKIICFAGPPGVGKTSIGKSIADALGRKFSRISVGGINDVAEIKGHRRTYVGAVPGRVIQALKQTQTQNPLILIDEIDKVGRVNTHGDPSAALLELLDPEQNSSFVDTFLDLPIDVSKVLFVCTANYIENIPAPLKDRMEIVDISGYVASERVAIAEQHLIPASKKASGLQELNVNIQNDAIEKLVSRYSRENGVRGLKKLIEKIHRKVALKIVEKYDTGESKEIEVEQNIDPKAVGAKQVEDDTKQATKKIAKLDIPENMTIDVESDGLKEYLGPPTFIEDRMYDETPAGVIMGLAYTEIGGTPLYVESVLQQPISVSSKPEFRRTGQLGDVMNESSSIAYSFCRMFMTKHFPENRFFDKAVIHLHCPEGAIKKDGPSAGVTMTTSLLSLALDHPTSSTACMTGELTLTGKVLRIGGLKEKVMAAKLAGAKTIFFPHDNLADWDNMPAFVREGLEPVAVKWYQEIFDHLFADLDKTKANQLWKQEIADAPHDSK